LLLFALVMNYIGSKQRLSSFILSSIKGIVGDDLSDKVYAEPFGGTGIIARYLKQCTKHVIASDIEEYSYVLLRNYIGNNKIHKQNKILVDTLNSLPPKKGIIYNNYCRGGGTDRQYFSDENGQIIDAARQVIGFWNSTNKISQDQYYFLLASLLESADKVANTASVYGAYLKKIKKTAQNKLIIKAANFTESKTKHEVFKEDANELIKKISGDILYLDPPYNRRQYGANYHILNTIALYDNFQPKGKTGLRAYYKSKYCKKNEVAESFDNLIANSQFKHIFISYNNEGLMTHDVIRNTLEKYGQYDLITTDYQRFKADTDYNRNHKADKTVEYLHVLKKT